MESQRLMMLNVFGESEYIKHTQSLFETIFHQEGLVEWKSSQERNKN